MAEEVPTRLSMTFTTLLHVVHVPAYLESRESTDKNFNPSMASAKREAFLHVHDRYT